MMMMILLVAAAACGTSYCFRGAMAFQRPLPSSLRQNHFMMSPMYHQQQRAYNHRHHSQYHRHHYRRHRRVTVGNFLSNQYGDDETGNEVSVNEPTPITTTTTTTSTDNNSNNSRMVRPFFARAVQRLMRKSEDSTNISADSTTIPNSLNSITTVTTTSVEKPVDSQADILHALAVKTRLEAEKMEIQLTLDKINKIERRILLTSSSSNTEARIVLSEEERANLVRDVQLLLTKLNANPSFLIEDKAINTTVISSSSPSLLIQDKAINTIYIKPTSDDDTESSSSTQSTEQPLDSSESNTTTTQMPTLSYEKQQEAISYFDKLPQPIREMMAKTAGIPTNSNSTAIITKLVEEGRLYESEESEGQFNIITKATDIAENADIFVDMEFAEINSYIQTLLPGVTRKEPVPMEYMDAFYKEVLGKDTFQPSERNPRPVPGGYLIRGTSMVNKSSKGKDNDNKNNQREDEGDILMDVIDAKIMSSSSLANKIRAYYILDPTPPSGEEILNDEDEYPVLLVTNYDVSPTTDAWVKPAVTFLGLTSIAIFALGAFAFNSDIIDKLSASANNPDDNLDWLYNLSLPLATSLLATQIFHELGHIIVAARDGMNIGMPTLVPGFQFGLTGGITPIKSPPKNLKSLFDFAIAGPIFGLVASMILLYTGLEMTAFMDASELQQLPTVPVEVLRSSALGGGLIDYLLGDGVLNTPDESQLIKLHPFAISGFSGLVLNALSLVPIGNTDGGRICTAFFGRSFSKVVQGTAILLLVLAGFFGADKPNTLLCYAIFCQCFASELEIPCRNEVDELDSLRGLVAIGMSLIVVLTLIPLP